MYTISELKTQGPASVYYFRNWKMKHLELYTIFGIENLISYRWTSIPELRIQELGNVLFSELKTQTPQVHTISRTGKPRTWNWTIVGTENWISWKCLPVLFGTDNSRPCKCPISRTGTLNQGLGTVHLFSVLKTQLLGCVFFSELKAQGLGSVYYFQN